MRRIHLIASYDGIAYFSSRVQPEAVTVEQKLTEAMQGLVRASARLILASRTDTSIHTFGSVAVFDTEFPMSVERLTTALSACLPPDIRTQMANEIALNWHPRKQHYKKTCEYRIQDGRVMNLLSRNSTAHCYVLLNLAAVCMILPSLLGEYGFVAFYANGSATSYTVRRVFRMRLTAGCERSGNSAGFTTLRITGSSFFRHMVWILAGTLLEVGGGREDTAVFQKALRSRARHDIDPVAPATGPILREIRYPPIPDRYVTDNGDWHYGLSQEDLTLIEVDRLTVGHYRPNSYAGLMTRLLHRSHRDGARCILLRNSEDSVRLVIEQHYGFYETRENTNSGDRNNFPYLVAKAESGAT